MKKSYSLFLLFSLTILQAFAQPSTAPTTPPARTAANVLSIYGAAYANHVGTVFNPDWGQTGHGSASEITVGTEKILSYPNFNYQGIDFSGSLNVASLDTLHLDVWTPNCTVLNVYLIDNPVDHENFVPVNLTLSGWNSVAIPLSQFATQGCTLNNIIQFKFVSGTPASSTIYLDNIYFYTTQSLPTITNFSVPSGLINTSAPFTLTQPTSNSTGAFTYTSSNTSVATISGTTVTITGVGVSTITAVQAAAGSYASGSITATLNVGYNPPTVAAPLPTVPAANVIPLLSSYAPYTPNRAIDTWGTSWQSAVTTDTTIATTRTIKYSNLVYSGTEFTGANSIDASGMSFFHVDIWTPNSSALSVKLVDFGANNVYDGGGDDKASQIVLDANPTPFQWNSYNIPLSAFATTGLDTRAHLSQLLFVGSTTTIFVENVYFSTVTTLPVNLAEFTATKMGTVAQLSWKTLSEINNKGFAVERSADGITWNQLQFVNASTSGSNGASYSATDNSPLNGVNYYRLKQVDNDGKIAYSSTASVNFAGSDVVGFSFYPNPAKTQINVALQTLQSNNASLSLINVDGKTVKTIALTNQNSNSNIQINLSDIASGNYFLVLKDGASIKTSKVLIN